MDACVITMRELTPAEMTLVSGGEFTWGEFFGHVAVGAGMGAMIGAAGAGLGAGPGAIGGGLIGGIEYCFGELIEYCF